MTFSLKHILKEYRLATSILGAILIVLVLSALSITLYIRDGTARLDLSRPGYESVRGQIEKDTSFPEFSANGPVDTGALKQFQKLYKQQTDKLNHFSSFQEKTLEDEQLLASPRPQ